MFIFVERLSSLLISVFVFEHLQVYIQLISGGNSSITGGNLLVFVEENLEHLLS